MIVGHGDDRYKYDVEIVGDFSSNVPYVNGSKALLGHLKQSMDVVSNYPDPTAQRLRGLIAEHEGVSPDEVLVTNGSAEAFYLMAQIFAPCRTMVLQPAFAEYEAASRIFNHDLRMSAVDQTDSVSYEDVQLLWLGRPNNPNGMIVDEQVISDWLHQNAQLHVIVDTAYEHLCAKPITLRNVRQKRLIEIHSLTKTFAIPGLRLGYVVADRSIIERCDAVRIPWSVNALALEAGAYIMTHYDELLPDHEALVQESKELQKVLSRLPDLEVIPSECNYFLCRMRRGTAADLKAYLVHHHGLLIRNADNFPMLTKQHFRLSVQGDRLNGLLVKAIEAYFNQL